MGFVGNVCAVAGNAATPLMANVRVLKRISAEALVEFVRMGLSFIDSGCHDFFLLLLYPPGLRKSTAPMAAV